MLKVLRPTHLLHPIYPFSTSSLTKASFASVKKTYIIRSYTTIKQRFYRG
jgi:hypothetical protein